MRVRPTDGPSQARLLGPGGRGGRRSSWNSGQADSAPVRGRRRSSLRVRRPPPRCSVPTSAWSPASTSTCCGAPAPSVAEPVGRPGVHARPGRSVRFPRPRTRARRSAQRPVLPCALHQENGCPPFPCPRRTIRTIRRDPRPPAASPSTGGCTTPSTAARPAPGA